MRKEVSIKIKQADAEHDRWWNSCVGHSFQATPRNGAVFEITKGPNVGCLINKNFADVK
jgi:hypothetical protein